MKTVYKSHYVHISNLAELFMAITPQQIEFTMKVLTYASKCPEIQYNIIKFNRETNKVSLLWSPDWDCSYEPIVGDCRTFDKNLNYKIIKGGSKVYHMKHTFVDCTYQGFDIAKSIERTSILESIPEIKQNKSRIGNLKYWRDLLKKYNLPVYMNQSHNY